MTATREQRRDDPAIEAWEHLLRFQRAATAAMDESLRSGFGRTLDDYDVMHQVASHDGPIQMGTLADRLLVANSSCNRIVERLVSAGLLDRARGAEDRRAVFVSLTSDGRRLHRRMASAHGRDIKRFVENGLTSPELHLLADLTSRLG